MFSNLKNKIVIISSPRTGSTPLLYDIHDYFKQQGTDLLLLNEPIYKGNALDYKIGTESLDTVICNQNFILKAHAADIQLYYSDFLKEKLRTDDISVVRIKRRDLAAQCVSTYISASTSLWFNNGINNLIFPTMKLEVNKNLIADTWSGINRCNEAYDTIDCNPIIDIFYEDCIFSTNDVVKNEKIANYEEIYNEFSKLILAQT